MTRQALPIDARLDDIVATVRSHGCVVLSAPPGSGKTTRVPPALADALPSGEIVVLEPRRIATRSAAARVAFERGEELGGHVGYQVRHERCVSRATRIRYVTEGILIRQLVEDPFLDGIAAVVLDEFHERHVETDLAVAMLREVRETVRPDLGVVVMSATLDIEPIRAFLGDCPVVEARGVAHPVEIHHAERVDDGDLADRVRATLRVVLADTDGDVLVFLPGVAEIARTRKRVADLGDLDVLPLHGALSVEEQDAALRPTTRRKVVLATNIAESSITIEGVGAVIDSGYARVLRHDPARALDTLRLERISLASAAQRAGRAGRTRSGRCDRLWTRAEERSLPAFDTPEILRTDLAGPALVVRAFAGRDPADFEWLDRPDPARLSVADQLLSRLGAVDDAGRVTESGRRLLRWPLHPRLARVMEASIDLGCRRSAAATAALLGERDLLRATGDRDAVPLDVACHVERLRAFERIGRGADPRIDSRAARSILRARDQLAGRSSEAVRADDELVARCLLAGFPDRVVRRAGRGSRDGLMVGGRAVTFRGEGLEDSELVLALDVRDRTQRASRAVVRLAVGIERAWLDEQFSSAVAEEDDVEFDASSGQVVAVRRTRFLDLVLSEHRGGRVDPAAAERVLAEAVRRDPVAAFGAQPALDALRARIRWLATVAPDPPLPSLDDAVVAEVAAGLCAGRRGLRELRDVPLLPCLLATWSRADRERLEREAPERVVLPSGRSVRIDYSNPQVPAVAARLQEFFGLAMTPTIGAGRVPLALHLLAPNQRPVQITTDLASFWRGVYPRVRSELRRRYPRHAWPEDPLSATPEQRPKPRR